MNKNLFSVGIFTAAPELRMSRAETIVSAHLNGPVILALLQAKINDSKAPALSWTWQPARRQRVEHADNALQYNTRGQLQRRQMDSHPLRRQ